MAETEKSLKETMESKLTLEAEVYKLRNHVSKLSEKCENLNNRIFTFISGDAMAFYTGFPSFAVFFFGNL